MKRILILLVLFAPVVLLAQKEIKPSVSKAEKALKDKKLDEAKAIIDVTVADQATMVDKKGAPSKSAAKAWYLKGLIYASIDTSKNEKFKALDPDPFPAAIEAFKKSDELNKEKKEPSFFSDAIGLPILDTQVKANLANAYYTKAAAAFQEEKDYKKAFKYVDQTIQLYPDTVFLNPAGVFFAPQAKETDKSIEWLNMYLQKGGTSSDAYVMLFSAYRDEKKDNDMALKIIKEARAKFPNNADFPKYELNVYVTSKQYDLAKNMIETELKADPNNKESYYMLGELNRELKNEPEAIKAFEKAIQLDPTYYDPIASLADISFKDVNTIRTQRNALNPNKDVAKRRELYMQIEKELKETVGYWEKLETLKPEEDAVLYGLLSIYGDLAVYDEATYNPKIEKLKKKMKGLGLEVD